jgi:hypothetical protein
MWGRLATCGRLAIGRPTFVRIFPPNTHVLFVPTFRRRRLPHYHCVGQATFLTWRLHGSLPQSRSFPSAIASGRAFLAMDRVLDTACNGPLFLRMPEIAKMVMDAIHYRDQRTYQLHSFVVMPNHVHLSGGSFQGDAIAQEIHCQGGQPNAGTHWPAILAG